MIENLRSEVASPVQETRIYDLKITGIKFQDGNLSKPLYPFLIDPRKAPAGVQFEPGVQIRSGQRDLTFLFQIDASSEAEFESDASGNPVIESLESPLDTDIAGLVATLLDAKTCQLTWRQSEADASSGGQRKVVAMRLCCRHPLPPTARERVDGGIYLAIINRPEGLMEEIKGADPALSELQTITILGTDQRGRPIYDLYFREALDGLPSDLSLEPTFRVHEGETVEFSMYFDLLSEGQEIRFLPAPGNPSEVAIKGYEPAGWPPQVRSSVRTYCGKRCTLTWVQDLGREQCTSSPDVKPPSYCCGGHVTSFMLEAFVGAEVEHFHQVADRYKRRLIDPTVIQPPSCTSGGICR